MPDESWQKGPLGEEFEKYVNRASEGSGWKRGLANWNAIQGEISSENSNFVCSLSISQRNSLRILLEWWTAEFQDESFMCRAKQVIREHASGSLAEERIPSELDLKVSLYHEKVFTLFLYEFFFYGKTTAAPIQLRRHDASLIAACQRLAYSTYSLFTKSSSSPLVRQLYSDMPLSEQTSNVLDKDGPLSAIIEACPWLPTEKREGWPYYLWDIENKRTVVVENLPEIPTYSIVSHTWGRWRIQGPGAIIPGVPWEVPRNSRFVVEDLPNILAEYRSVFLPTRFLWFDLFCIPQDESGLADIEISRQAAIFGAATKAMVWLNDIDDWSGVQGGIQWIAAQYLKISAGALYDVQPVLSEIRRSSNSTTHLFEEFTHITPNSGVGQRPSGWFTSLWTLQESFLRPDMMLYNSHWKALKLHNDANAMPVTFDSILALVDFDKKHGPFELNDDTPPAVNEICALVHHTCLDELLEYSPLTALTLGSRRECTKGRAEAIMSVFGATSWFLKTDRSCREKNLVLGKYPIQFLREVRDIVGANFFASNYGFCCFWDIFQPREDGDLEVHVAGTLLPFDPLRNESKFVCVLNGSEIIDHPSTKSWQLADDGRVVMPEVAVVASTDDDIDEETNQALLATIIGPSPKEPQKMDTQVGANLHEWMRTCFSDLPKHALCLQRGAGGWSRGVILMAVYEDEEPPKTFAKIGDYYTNQSEDYVESKIRKIDWEVM